MGEPARIKEIRGTGTGQRFRWGVTASVLRAVFEHVSPDWISGEFHGTRWRGVSSLWPQGGRGRDTGTQTREPESVRNGDKQRESVAEDFSSNAVKKEKTHMIATLLAAVTLGGEGLTGLLISFLILVIVLA